MENIEIERKFTVDYNSSNQVFSKFISSLFNDYKRHIITQTYIKSNTQTVLRLRKIKTYANMFGEPITKYWLTIKFNIKETDHQQCYEIENEISKGMYESLIANDDPDFIVSSFEKTRIEMPYNNHLFEIDLFLNTKLGELMIIEVEFKEGEEIIIPDKLKNLLGFREVTNDPQYFNCNLV